MTFQPIIIHLGPLTITGYGIMMMVGFLAAGWAIQRELRRRKLNEDYSSSIVVAAVIGGILGAKLWYVALTRDPSALLSRGGLVWYGGLFGGAAGVLLNGWRERVPMRITLEICAPALALGYALGRVGCFLVQDDYGIPTSLPWGFKFPEGLPPTTAQNLHSLFRVPIPPGTPPNEVLAVHPTQLYEVIIMLTVFAILWRLRSHRHAMGWLFGLYLTFAGLERLFIEFLRAKDDRFLGPFTVAQLTSVLICTLGVVLMSLWWRESEFSIPEDAKVLKPKEA